MVTAAITVYFGSIPADFGSITPHSGANKKATETRRDQKTPISSRNMIDFVLFLSLHD